MNLKKIDHAVAEAQRFMKTAEALKAAKQKRHEQYRLDGYNAPVDYANCPREQGALRRASMDLTRALADLRRPK